MTTLLTWISFSLPVSLVVSFKDAQKFFGYTLDIIGAILHSKKSIWELMKKRKTSENSKGNETIKCQSL